MSGRPVLKVGVAVAAAVGVLLLLRGARPAPVPAGLRVVTTTPILASLTTKVLGSDGTITNLVPPGASPENYALQPLDARALEEATVIVRVGLGFERFLDPVLAEAERRGVMVITAGTGVPTLPLPEAVHAGALPLEVAPQAPRDPHLWVDPRRATLMVENIARGLAVANPARAGVYREREAQAVEALDALDTEIATQLAPFRGGHFIAFHPAWGYFAERYGLRQVAVVELVPGREPTARELRELTGVVRATGVKALLTEPQFSSAVADALARDLGLSVHEVNPEGGDLDAGGYDRWFRAQAAVFARALSE